MRYRIEGEGTYKVTGEVWVDPARDPEMAEAAALLHAEKHLRVTVSPDGFRLSATIGCGRDERLKIEGAYDPDLWIGECLD